MFKSHLTLMAIVLFCTSTLVAQQTATCKVLLTQIAGMYDGQCKDGLANGKGKSLGEDEYSGMFRNGLPDGKGKYTYKNGDIYDGYWTNGSKNGQGKFSYTLNGQKMTLKGYWANGDYVGVSNPDEPYRVTAITGIESYSIKKTEAVGAHIKIAF